MKKFMLAGAILFATTLTSFANTPGIFDTNKDVVVSYKVKEAFFREFGSLDNVTWKMAKGNLYRAMFTLYNEQVSAFFNEDGNLVATTTDKTIAQLPAKLRGTIGNKLKGQAISDVFEMVTDTEQCYYFKATDANGSRLYKAFGSGSIQLSDIALR